SLDGKIVALAGTAGLELLDATSFRPLTQLDQEHYLSLAVFDPSGRQIAGCVGSDVLIWDVATRRLRGRLRGSGATKALAFSPAGSRLACGSAREDKIRIWDSLNLTLALRLQGNAGGVTSLGFSPNGKQLVSASTDGSLTLWRTELPGSESSRVSSRGSC